MGEIAKNHKRRAVILQGYEDLTDAQYVKIRDVVLILAVSRDTVQKLVRKGVLNTYKPFRRHVFYNLGEIRRHIATREEQIEPLYVVCGSSQFESAGQFKSLHTDKEVFEYAEEVEKQRNSVTPD